MEQNVEALNANQRISQVQRASFQWFHESQLPQEAITPAQPSRAHMILELQNHMSLILMVQENLSTQQIKYKELHSTVEQRMRWACGANPDLQEVFDAYSTSFAAEMDSLRRLTTIGKTIWGTINAVLHHEALRTNTNTESTASDGNFVGLVTDCQNAASLQHNLTLSQTLTEQELALFNMNPPKESSEASGGTILDFAVDRNWILGTEQTIAAKVKQVQADLAQENKRLQAALTNLHQSVGNDLKRTVNIHQKLMADVGALLRAIDKSADAGGGETEYEVPEIQIYLGRYRIFSDLISNLMQELAVHGEDLTEDRAQVLLRTLDHLKDIVNPIYEGLVEFATLLREENIEIYKKTRKDVNGAGEAGIAGGGNTAKSSESDQHNASNLKEEKNTFALNVLRRVRAKLEGREPDVLRRSTVAEQVDFIIREATNLDNLALLYEGWTAWI